MEPLGNHCGIIFFKFELTRFEVKCSETLGRGMKVESMEKEEQEQKEVSPHAEDGKHAHFELQEDEEEALAPSNHMEVDADDDDENEVTTFLVKNLDTGEYERVTLEQMLNGGIVDSGPDIQEQEEEEEGNETIAATESPPNLPPPEPPENCDLLSPVEQKLVRAGILILAGVEKRRKQRRLLKALSTWQAVHFLEGETQKYAEEISAKNEEVEKLNRENTDLRVSATISSTPNQEVPVSEDSEPSEGKLKLRYDERYAKFFKMLKVNVPKGAVALKMEQEGLDPSMLDRDPEESIETAVSSSENAARQDEFKLKDDKRYAKFFKMLKVNVPKGAVALKMEQEGLNPSILDYDPEDFVEIDKGKTNDDVGCGKEMKIRLKDDERYAPFFKMLKVNVPRGAVESKMKQKGLDHTVLDRDPEELIDVVAAPKENKVKLKDDERYAPFFKMLKVNVPRGAVELKMKQKGLDPAMLDKDPETTFVKNVVTETSEREKKKKRRKSKETAKKREILLKDDERYRPFFKMLKVCVPRGAVELKMQQKGLDPSMLDKDPEKTRVSVPSEVKEEKKIKLKDDERYGAFFKMIKVNVPRAAVELKMKQKGLDPSMLDEDPETTMVPVSDEEKSLSEGGDTGDAKNNKKKNVEAPKKKPDRIIRRKIHWKKVSEKALDEADDKTIWNKCGRFKFEQRELKEMNLFFTVNVSEQERRKAKERAEKEKLEGNESASAKMKKRKQKKTPKKQLLDPQRSNNLSIVLSRMKSKGIDSRLVRMCLYSLEFAEGVSKEDLRSILGLLPTPDEEKELKKWDGGRSELEKGEQYFLDLMDIPRFRQRVNCFLYKMKFDEIYEETAIDFSVLIKACDDVLSGQKLRRIMEIVLAIGNFLNEGEEAPSNRLAQGFSLEALEKLGEVKSFQAKTTALHYMVMLIQSRQVELVGYVKSDTDNIREAANVSLENALAQLQVLENGVKAVETEVAVVAKTLEDGVKREAMTEEDKTFAVALNNFYKYADKSAKDLRASADKAEALFADTVTYFLEDKGISSGSLFGSLQRFFADFELALNQNDAARQKFLKRQKAQRHNMEEKKTTFIR